MGTTRFAWSGGLFALLLAVGCTDEPLCPAGTFADKADLHVAVTCGSSAGDGSADAPFASIQAAIDKASAGNTIAVAAGTYEETLATQRALTIIGAGSGAVTLKPPEKKVGLAASGGALVVKGLTIEGAAPVGLMATGIELTAEDIVIKSTRRVMVAAAQQAGGHGIQVADAPKATLRDIVVTDGTGAGVLFVAGGELVVESTRLDAAQGSPRVADKPGEVDAAFTKQACVVSGNRGGGIVVVGKTMPDAPPPTKAPTATLSGVHVDANWKYGVAFFGSGGSIARSAVTATRKSVSTSAAEGIFVGGDGAAAENDLVIGEDVVISGHHRAGVIFAIEADAAKMALTVDADVSNNGFGGIWVRGHNATATIGAKARVATNKAGGVIVGSNADLKVGAALIASTKRFNADTKMAEAGNPADGLTVVAGARAELSGTVFKDNARAAIVVDGPAIVGGKVAVTATAVTVEKGAYGVVVNTPDGTTKHLVKKSAVSIAGDVKTPVVHEPGFSVLRSVCEKGKSGPCLQ